MDGELIKAAFIGLVGGTLVGTTGVGAGSVIAASLLIAFPTIAPQIVVGSATIQAVVMKLVAVAARRQFRLREGRLGVAMAAGAIPLAAAGAWASSLVRGEDLRPLLLVVLLAVGLLLIRQAVPRWQPSIEPHDPVERGGQDRGSVRQPPESDVTGADAWDTAHSWDAAAAEVHVAEPRRLHVGLVGSAVGFIAGLTSIGTGTLFVSALVGPLRVDSHRAVAAALLAGLMTLFVSGLTHATLGHLDPALVLGTCLGSVPGVLLGTMLAHRTSGGVLRGTIGAGIAVAAVVALARL